MPIEKLIIINDMTKFNASNPDPTLFKAFQRYQNISEYSVELENYLKEKDIQFHIHEKR